MKTLAQAFEHTLKDVYFAENAVVKALQEAASAATHKDLKEALKAHALETNACVDILGDVFKSIDRTPEGEKCDAIEGLIKECKGVVADSDASIARNVLIVGCCQAIEHYEIARFGTLREWAKTLGHEEAHVLLGHILDHHRGADHKLSHLAIATLNLVRK